MTHAASASRPAAVPVLDGLSEIVARYDGFIFDLWGVIHDGLKPFPNAVATLKALKAAGKRACLLSNAPRRCDAVIARLEEIGVPRDAYDEILTSGEAAHMALRDRADPWHAALGRRLYHLGSRHDDSVYKGLDYEIVDRPDQADFVLNTGILAIPSELRAETVDVTQARYEPVLQDCRAAGLPMICANPDLVVMVGSTLTLCAGSLAARYEALGGDVRWHGKPHLPVYERCLDLLGVHDRRKVLALGDAFRTDIAGANGAGIDSVLVVAGIHADEFGPAGRPDGALIAEAGRKAGHEATFAMAELKW